MYLAIKLVPAQAQQILPSLSVARWMGLALLTVLEIRLLLAVFKMVLRGGGSADELAKATGAPPWLARLLALEARFWIAVANLFKRR